ncbi:MAG: hypothetical protein WB586_12690, partial [Chthoniobacterales bacterium]
MIPKCNHIVVSSALRRPTRSQAGAPAAAVLHRGLIWGYPIGLETVTLIYNKNLLVGPPSGSSPVGSDQPTDQNEKSGC